MNIKCQISNVKCLFGVILFFSQVMQGTAIVKCQMSNVKYQMSWNRKSDFHRFSTLGKSDFLITSKSSNQIDIRVTNDFESVIFKSGILESLIDEFNEIESPYLYQSRLIAIPEDENVDIIIKSIDSVLIPYDFERSITEKVNLREGSLSSYPFAFLGHKGIMRDLKVAPLVIRQFGYNETTKNIVCYKNVVIELKFNSESEVRLPYAISEGWDDFYRNSVLNYDRTVHSPLSTVPSQQCVPQGYLIIVADALYNNILPLAQWKNLKGWTVTVKRKSEVGTTSTEIKNYIAQAYSTWTPRLEYVLLVGVGNPGSSNINIPPMPAIATYGDHLYSCVAGDDLYPDLFIGRLPASTPSELAVMVAKIITYEQTPFTSDTSWYKRALMVATSYQQTGTPVWTALACKRAVRNLLLEHGYRQVDTVFHPPVSSGVGIIDTIINRGTTFVNGRGWGNREGWTYPYFKISEVNSLNNGWKLPVVTSFYCATGNYTAYPSRCFGEVWLYAGSPTIPKGGVAFYGPIYANTSTRFNNCQDYSIYWGIFEKDIYICGPAMFYGKIALLNNFPLPSDSEKLNTHINTYNLLGDPSLYMWTEVPRELVVSCPSEIPVGSSTITVMVRNTVGEPISGALVSLYKTNEVKKCAITDFSGNATLDFITETADTLFVTVTLKNYIPHLKNVRVISHPVYVGCYSYSGSAIAGQIANLNISLKNYGSSQTANNTFAILRTQSPYITMIDSLKSYGNILPGQITSAGPFQFSVATNCTNNYPINFQMSITTTNNNYEAGFTVSVRAAELKYLNHTVNDGGNQILEPGEISNLVIKISNYGLENLSNVSGVLRCTNPWIIRVIDSLGYFGNIASGDSLQNDNDYFILEAASGIGIGRIFHLQLEVKNPDGYRRIIEFPITIGVITNNAPTGPDNYGYWAYDNTDIAYNECPTYDWVEIDPNFGGQGTKIPLSNDAIRVINLPFPFTYYGRNYTKISVCSNGYAALDSTGIIDPYNWSIPSPLGPPNMLAVMWDDFHPDTTASSGVYYYHDVSNNRFVIEWSRVRHIHGFSNPVIAESQTFQIILYNPVFYPTRTGDGPIIFQYHTVFNDDSLTNYCHNYATVGIENFEHTDGIEYTFAGQYPISAAEIISGRAIKFSTNPPDTFTSIKEMSNVKCQMSNVMLQISPNPFRDKTEISYSVPINGHLSINIYDISGKLIKNLINRHEQSCAQSHSGNYKLQMSAIRYPPGIYFVILTAKNDKSIIKKSAKIILH